MENLMNVTLSKKRLLFAGAAAILVFMLVAALVVGGVFLHQALGQLSQPVEDTAAEQQLQAQVQALEQQLAVKDNELAAKDNELAAKDAELATLRSTAVDPAEIERLKAANQQLAQSLEESQAMAAQLQAENQDLNTQLEQLTQEKTTIINNYSRRFVVVVKVLENRFFTEHDSGMRYKAYVTAEEFARIQEGDTLTYCPDLDITANGNFRIVVVEKYVAELPGIECPAV